MASAKVKDAEPIAIRAESPRRRVAIATLKSVVACCLLLWLVLSGRLDLSAVASPAHRGAQLFGLLAVSLSLYLQYVRWWILLRAQGIRITLRQSVEISLVAQFLAVLLPGASGSEVVRAYYISRATYGRHTSGAVSVVADRALGLCTLLWVSVLGFVAMSQSQPSSPRAFVLVVGTAVAGTGASILLGFRKPRAIVLMALPRRLRTRLDAAIASTTSNLRSLAAALALSAAATFCVILAFVAASRAVDSDADWFTVCAVAPLVLVVSVLPISPSGLGVAETAASFSFGQFGVSNGAAIMAMFRLWNLVLCLPGAILYLTRKRADEMQTDESQSSPTVPAAASPSRDLPQTKKGAPR